MHEDIAKKGEGRFSVWGEYFCFFSSDNTDPLTNGEGMRSSGRPRSQCRSG